MEIKIPNKHITSLEIVFIASTIRSYFIYEKILPLVGFYRIIFLDDWKNQSVGTCVYNYFAIAFAYEISPAQIIYNVRTRIFGIYLFFVMLSKEHKLV